MKLDPETDSIVIVGHDPGSIVMFGHDPGSIGHDPGSIVGKTKQKRLGLTLGVWAVD